MNTDEAVPEARLDGDLPVTEAASAADRIGDDATVLVSGFGSVGCLDSARESRR